MKSIEGRSAGVAHTAIEEAILATVVYSDLFDYPLTLDQLVTWLPRAVDRAALEHTLASSEWLRRNLSHSGPYVTLCGRERTVQVRQRRELSSARLLSRARFWGRLMARLPFVRMVAITGSLAVDNADEDADLDFLIVTAPGRLWTARAMVILLVRLASLRGATVCPNYLLSEQALTLDSRDHYTARELLQMQPLSGHSVYAAMLAANEWWREFLPNAAPAIVPAGRASASLLRRCSEKALLMRPFDVVERFLSARKVSELRRQARGGEALFSDNVCKGHFEGWREQTQTAMAARMAQFTDAPS
jgi:hypothetical protein